MCHFEWRSHDNGSYSASTSLNPKDVFFKISSVPKESGIPIQTVRQAPSYRKIKSFINFLSNAVISLMTLLGGIFTATYRCVPPFPLLLLHPLKQKACLKDCLGKVVPRSLCTGQGLTSSL